MGRPLASIEVVEYEVDCPSSDGASPLKAAWLRVAVRGLQKILP